MQQWVSTGGEHGRRLLAWLALGLAMAGVLWLTAGLHGGFRELLSGQHVIGAFHDSHVWGFDQVARLLAGTESAWRTTDRLGWPHTVALPLVAWVPAVWVAPVRFFLGPVEAFNLALVLGPVVTVGVTWLWLRDVFRAPALSAAAASVCMALCPYALGCLASGQVEKVQLWCLPLVLWCADRAVRGSLRWWFFLALGTAAAAFTSPFSALVLPFALVAQLAGSLGTTVRVRRVVGVLGVVALVLAGVRGYYGSIESAPMDGGAHQFGSARMVSAFSPGTPPAEEALLEPSIVAQPQEMLLGRHGRQPGPTRVAHVTYLGLPFLLVFVLGGIREWRGRWLAVSLVGLGIALAMGPRLAVEGAWLEVGGRGVVLPAAWLEALGYPTRESGMYYRFIQLSSLGLALCLGVGVGTRFGRWGPVLACVLGGLQVADSLRYTADLWPRTLEPVPHEDVFRQWAMDPVPGAVVDLPLAADQRAGGVYMLAATLHGRSTTALARQSRPDELPHLLRVRNWLEEAIVLEDPARGRALLASRGIQYVACHARCMRTRDRVLELRAALGPGEGSDSMQWWRMEP